MITPVDVKLYFNFRSPYCYVASKVLFEIFDEFHAHLIWRPLGSWAGRSSPERAKVKLPLTRQDVARITKKMGIPMNPPPVTTDPTKAGAGSLLAESKGLLQPYLVEMMRTAWAHSLDIGETEVVLNVGDSVGLDRAELADAIQSPANLTQREKNWEEAQELGVIGVPTFVIDKEIFWGSDRIDYLKDHLRELRLSRL